MSNKNIKRALLTSVLSCLLCLSMFVGSTFAWFTDSVSSKNNVIVAGNLDVVLEYKKTDSTDWTEVTEDTALFSKDSLWEPGHKEIVALRISNAGTLALKYDLATLVTEEVAGTNVYGEEFLLSEYLEVYQSPVQADGVVGDILMDLFLGDRDYKTAATSLEFGKSVDNPTPSLHPGTAHVVAIAIEMPKTVGNDANPKTGTIAPSISFDVTVVAAQYAYEEDSFGSDYDKDAKFPGEVATADELAAALASNEDVKLLNDIVLTGEWTPIGNKDEGVYFTGTLDGNGHTISGLSVNNGDYVALISAAKGATIKNLTVEGAVAGENAAGVVARVEGNTVIENVTSNVAVSGSTKAGGIACNVTNSGKTVFKNCVNNGAVSGGNSGIGGIVGYANNDAYVEILSCENNADVTSDNNKYAGAAVGYAAGTSKGIVADMKNTGNITGALLGDGRYLKYGETVLCGYVGTIGNWTAALTATPDDVQTVIANVLEGGTVLLSEGEYGTIVAKSNISIMGTLGAVVDCVNLNGSNNVKLLNIGFDAAGAQAAIDHHKGGTVRAYANIIAGTATTSVGMRNIVIDGCTFAGKFADNGVSTAIAFADRSRPTGGSGDVTIKNCSFITEGATYDVYGYYTGNPGLTFTIENNTFASNCQFPVYLGRLKTSAAIVVKGNTFKNTDSLENSVSIQGDNSYTPTLAASDNTFEG